MSNWVVPGARRILGDLSGAQRWNAQVAAGQSQSCQSIRPVREISWASHVHCHPQLTDLQQSIVEIKSAAHGRAHMGLSLMEEKASPAWRTACLKKETQKKSCPGFHDIYALEFTTKEDIALRNGSVALPEDFLFEAVMASDLACPISVADGC